jgi:flagellar biosynthesis protein FlhA
MVLDPGIGLDARIGNMRRHVAASFGLILPEIRLTDDAALPPGTYVIRIQGVEQARDRLHPARLLAIDPGTGDGLPGGEPVREPVYGAPARWILATDHEAAALAGMTVVTPTEVLATHLLEVMKRNFARLLTLKSLRRLLEEVTRVSDPDRAEANRRLLAELVPDRVPVDLVLTIMRMLLDERVSVRNWPLILESIAEVRGALAAPEAICEHVRQRLGFQLVGELKRPDGSIPLVQLAPEWEQAFAAHQVEGERGLSDVALPPEMFNRLAQSVADKIAKAGENGTYPAVVTSTRRRRFLRMVLIAKGIQNPVLSFDEIGIEAQPALVGLVPA